MRLWQARVNTLCDTALQRSRQYGDRFQRPSGKCYNEWHPLNAATDPIVSPNNASHVYKWTGFVASQPSGAVYGLQGWGRYNYPGYGQGGYPVSVGVRRARQSGGEER